MTATYELATDIGKVRLHSSDTDIESPWLQDEEIQVYLDMHSDEDEPYQHAALDVIDAILRKMAMVGNVRADWLAINYTDAVKLLKTLKKQKKKEFGLVSYGTTVAVTYRADSLQTGSPEDWES